MKKIDSFETLHIAEIMSVSLFVIFYICVIIAFCDIFTWTKWSDNEMKLVVHVGMKAVRIKEKYLHILLNCLFPFYDSILQLTGVHFIECTIWKFFIKKVISANETKTLPYVLQIQIRITWSWRAWLIA